jgi:hypothetical protein
MLPESEQRAARLRNVWIVLGTLNLGVASFSLWNYHSGSATRQVVIISAAIVLAFGNLGALYSLRTQLKKGGIAPPQSLIPAAITFAIISFAITIFGSSHLHHHSGYIDLALSNTPLSSIEPEQKRLVVELLRLRAESSRENDKELADAQAHPLNPQLYTPESFASKAVIESTMANLTKFMNIDLRYAESLEETMHDFRQKMAACDPAYLQSWDESEQKQEAVQASTMQAEREWFASVTSLYSYAEIHAADITLKQGRLVITPAPVLATFNQQMSHSKDLQQKLSIRQAGLVKAQQQAKQGLIIPPMN